MRYETESSTAHQTTSLLAQHQMIQMQTLELGFQIRSAASLLDFQEKGHQLCDVWKKYV